MTMHIAENPELIHIYRQFDAEIARQVDRLRSNRQFERELFLPSAAAIAEMEQKFQSLLELADQLPAPGPVFALLKRHFREFLLGQLSALQSRFERPGQAIRGLSSTIDFLLRKDSRSAQERCELLSIRLSQAAALWSVLHAQLAQTKPEHLRELVEACHVLGRVALLTRERLPAFFVGLPPAQLHSLEQALLQLSENSEMWARQAERALLESSGSEEIVAACDDDTIQLDEEYYRRLLREELGVELDHLLDWFVDEVEKTRSEVFAIASRLNLGGRAPQTMAEVVETLNRHAGPCRMPEEMFARGREYLARAKAGCQGYVTLPEESCEIGQVPEIVRTHYPWGGYGGGCPRRRPLRGEMFLNETNFRAVTDGWLKMMAIHEAYPGHHVQFVRANTDPLPETVRMGARSVPLTEGTAHRSERVFEFVFAEDPFYPLFVAYRRHHTSVRIKAELYLRYFGRPIKDAVQLYMDELGFDYATARGQVKAQELMVGYFNCYYYGLKRLQDLEQQYGYDQRSFTELLFSVGRVSLSTFADFLALSETDKKRLLTEFPSLVAE
ncbi:MAG: DUF885 family protein [Bacillota bacterium]